jgi:hypothetical protein
MKIDNFFAELKRRNVYKVAVAYAIVGWLIMQIAATVVPALHLSDAITSAVVLLTLLGFPIALVLAWAFELTPDGRTKSRNVCKVIRLCLTELAHNENGAEFCVTRIARNEHIPDHMS